MMMMMCVLRVVMFDVLGGMKMMMMMMRMRMGMMEDGVVMVMWSGRCVTYRVSTTRKSGYVLAFEREARVRVNEVWV